MKVYAKLVAARNILAHKALKKSGHNKFAGYQYFELGDFLPEIQSIFAEVGLVDVITFTADLATMTVYDCDDGSSVVFTSPMGSAQLKGCHEVQNIGAVETYQRRYLYVTAMAIVEHDALDATTGGVAPEVKAKPTPTPSAPAKAAPKADADPNKVLLVDSLLDVATQFSTTAELASLWKANQGQIDDLKTSEPELFKRLKDGFASLKTNLKEE
jgi:hypothetical protein